MRPSPKHAKRCCLALARCATICISSAKLATALGAQEAGSPALSMDAVVRTALDLGTDLRLARRQLMSAVAGRDVASAPYAAQMRAFVVSANDRSQVDESVSAPRTTILSTSTRYGVSMDKLLRSGIVVSPSLAVTRADLSSATLPPPNRAVVNLGVTVPLMRGLGGSPARAGEVAADQEARAGEFDVRQAAARTVLTAVLAYWDYVASYRRLDAQRLAERRADDLATETRALVRADERAPSELLSLDANSALKRITRISAEQGILDARQRLGVALGIGADAVQQLGEPGTGFPESSDLNAPDSALADALATMAPTRRPDLDAARGRELSALATASGTAADARSKLDLVVAIGYAGAERGGALRQYYTPFYRGVAGVNSTFQLTFQPASSVGGAHGRRQQAEASVQRTAIISGDLARVAMAATRTAVGGLRSARLQLETAEIAVALSQRSVASEAERFRRGMSTRFDVIQAEDALTGALLSRIAAQTLAAQALVRLRYEAGRLVSGTATSGLRVDALALVRSTAVGW
jgi:outer membrane protein